MFYNLHLLRVIAAIGVVYFHTTSSAGLALDFEVGSRGVDIFFVISGFIIAYIGTRRPEQFLTRRLIRLVPFYWAATLVLFIAVNVAPLVFRTTSSSVRHLVASLLFIPHEHAGEMQPTMILGWSLNYEMFFYLAFALALRVSTTWAPVLCGAWITAIAAIAATLPSEGTILGFYGRPIVLEFCYGIAAYYLLVWCRHHGDFFARSAVLKASVIAAVVLSLVAIGVGEVLYGQTVPRHLAAGLPAFVLVSGALILEQSWGVSMQSRTIFVLGEASYIIYLIHPYVIYGVLRLLFKDTTGLTWPALTGLIVGLLLLTCAVSVAIHLYFERPVLSYLRGRIDERWVGPHEGARASASR